MTSLLGADDRAYLNVDNPVRYALGDPANPVVTLNAADAFGCLWAADVPEGWEMPEIDVPMDRRPVGNGGYAGEPALLPRTVTLAGGVAAPTPAALAAARARFMRAVLGPLPAMWRYTHLDEAPARGLWVYPSGKPLWRALDDRIAEFSVVLVAEDPIKTSAAASYGPVRLPAAGGEGGLVAPLTAPLTSAGGPAARVTVLAVPNAGDEASDAVYAVTGPVPQPRIDLGTGAFVQLLADLGALDTWVVDTAAGSFTVNGVNRYDAWGPGSTFPLIPGSDPITGAPGGTEVRLRSASGGSDPAAGLTVTTASSWK